MKKYIFTLFFVLFTANMAFSADKEFKFRKNILFTITYQISENETRMLENVYFRNLWESGSIETEPALLATGDTLDMSRKLTYVEFLKVYENGRKESYLVPLKNIVEIKMLITKGLFKAGTDPSAPSEPQADLELKIK